MKRVQEQGVCDSQGRFPGHSQRWSSPGAHALGSAPHLRSSGGSKPGCPFPVAKLCSSPTLCSLRRRTWFPSKYRTFMLFKESRFNCWWLDRQIGMYLCGEHSDPTKHFSAPRTENCGICHLTQQEADGANLEGLLLLFFPGCCGFAASAPLGPSRGISAPM